MRFRLRTLLVLLTVLPPLLGVAWIKYSAWRAEQARQLDSDSGWIIEVRSYQMHAAPVAEDHPPSAMP